MATTEIQAINIMLRAMGVSPVESLDSGVFEAAQARDVLKTVSREVQSDSWYWNREQGIKLQPNTQGEIPIPAGTLAIDASDPHIHVRPLGGYLYDNTRHTRSFPTGLKVDVTWELSWEDLPEPAKQYIYLLAAQRLQLDLLGSESLDKQLDDPIKKALERLRKYDTSLADYNILTGDYDTYAIWNR